MSGGQRVISLDFYRDQSNVFTVFELLHLSQFSFFFAVLGFELRAYILSLSTSPFVLFCFAFIVAGWGYIVTFTKVLTMYQIYQT
jgi:hypothetical protein